MPRWFPFKIEYFGIRILALFLALILWFVATERPQRNLGLDQRTVTVQLAQVNVNEELEIAEVPATVDVTLEGPRLVLPFQAGDAAAAVDLAGLGAGAHRVPVTVQLPPGITLRSVDPRDVVVRLEERASRRVPVYVAVQGVPTGVNVRITQVEPASLQVIGARSAVERVAHLQATLRFAPAAEEPVRTPVMPVDGDGAAVPGVFVPQGFVTVTLQSEGEPAER